MRTLALAVALCAQVTSARATTPEPPRPDPPAPDTLFGCPIAADAAAFEATDAWPVRELAELGISVRLPASWEIELSPELVTLRSPDGGDRLALRRGRLVGSAQLATVRKSFELRELGPSHAGPSCEQTLRERLAPAGFVAVEVGVYARPFGRRQRSYAIFGGLPDGSLTAVLTVRWSRRSKGPDLSFVRRVLGGVRALAAAPAAANDAAPASAISAR
ncbi:MAG: hypothetical protein R3F39_16875 [Myxococcota bacterium]